MLHLQRHFSVMPLWFNFWFILYPLSTETFVFDLIIKWGKMQMSMNVTLSFSCHRNAAASYFVPHLQKHFAVLLAHPAVKQKNSVQFRKTSKSCLFMHRHYISDCTKFCNVAAFFLRDTSICQTWSRICVWRVILMFVSLRSVMECEPYLSPMTASCLLASTPLNSASGSERQRTYCRRLRPTMQTWRWMYNTQTNANLAWLMLVKSVKS